MGKSCQNDQHSFARSVGSQPVSLGETSVQIRKNPGVAEKVYTQLKWNSARAVTTLSYLASSTNICSSCRMRTSHPMQSSYCWNGVVGSSWGRVFWRYRVRTSSTTRIDPLSLTGCRCSCRAKQHQQQHRKKQITQPHTQREKILSEKVTGICTRGKIKFAVKRGLRKNLECEASTPFTQN